MFESRLFLVFGCDVLEEVLLELLLAWSLYPRLLGEALLLLLPLLLLLLLFEKLLLLLLL